MDLVDNKYSYFRVINIISGNGKGWRFRTKRAGKPEGNSTK
jgi:hypothetical protein